MSTITDFEKQLDDATSEVTAAKQRAADVEAAIIAGDTKHTIADVEAEESKARYADLRAKNAERELVRARESERSAAIKQIRSEILTHELGDPDYFIRMLRDVEEAIITFRDAVDRRSDVIRDWIRRLHELTVEPFEPDWTVPPAEQFGIAHFRNQYAGYHHIRVDDKTIGTINAESYLKQVFDEPIPERRVRDLARDLRSELGASVREQTSTSVKAKANAK